MDGHRETGATEGALEGILSAYALSFRGKVFEETSQGPDLLMEAFGVTPDMKRANAQFWGRELGMCWQRLVVRTCADRCRDFAPPVRVGADEPCDLVAGGCAIDTKYRLGSGDSGTLKKLRDNGPLLRGMGLRPVMLILRDDSLPGALSSVARGGWEIRTGGDAFAFLADLTGFDMAGHLAGCRGRFGAGA